MRRLEPASVPDFRRLHSERNGCAWCQCVAWWVPTWDSFGQRTAEQNRELRESLFARGELDGYLAYEDSEPVGWCHVGPRDRLQKLVEQFDLEPDSRTWAITCFQVAPSQRGRGVARTLLRAVLADLPSRGAARVEAFPRRTDTRDPMELWTGPEALYLAEGFTLARDHPERPTLRHTL